MVSTYENIKKEAPFIEFSLRFIIFVLSRTATGYVLKRFMTSFFFVIFIAFAFPNKQIEIILICEFVYIQTTFLKHYSTSKNQ